MPRKAVVEIAEELRNWLPNFDRGPNEFPILVWRVLASLPGGDDAEGLGFEPFNMGWKESELLEEMLAAVQDKRDVEDLVALLLKDEE